MTELAPDTRHYCTITAWTMYNNQMCVFLCEDNLTMCLIHTIMAMVPSVPTSTPWKRLRIKHERMNVTIVPLYSHVSSKDFDDDDDDNDQNHWYWWMEFLCFLFHFRIVLFKMTLHLDLLFFFHFPVEFRF